MPERAKGLLRVEEAALIMKWKVNLDRRGGYHSWWEYDYVSGEFENYIIRGQSRRQGLRENDIRHHLKRWDVIVERIGRDAEVIEPWKIPFHKQPKARLSKSRRNHEKSRTG